MALLQRAAPAAEKACYCIITLPPAVSTVATQCLSGLLNLVLPVQLSLEAVAAVCLRTRGVLELPQALESAAGQQVEQTERSAKKRRLSSKQLAGQLKHLSRSESRGGSQPEAADAARQGSTGRKVWLITPRCSFLASAS